MKTINDFEDFTGLYQLSKTLRFELKPQGKTLEHIENNGLIEQDEHRAYSYKLVKKIIDEYHKSFIEKSLHQFRLEYLDEYLRFYQIQKREDAEKKKFEEIQIKLRKQIAEQFSKQDAYKSLFSKELIKIDLMSFVQEEDQRKLVKEFENFTTYFTGFHENRQNMYSSEEISTAIAYRLIHQNLPRFIDNMRAFEKISQSPVKDKFNMIVSDQELGPVIQVVSIEEVFSLDFFNETLTQTGIEKYNHLLGGFTSEDGKVKKQGLNEYINLYNQTAAREDRIPKLKPLYKQILSDRLTASFIPEQFKSDNELLESIEKLYQELNTSVFNPLKEILSHLSEYDLYKIHLRNDTGLTDISQKIFADWGMFQKSMNLWFDQNYNGKAKPGTEKYDDEQRKYFSKQDSFSVQFINDCLALHSGQSNKNRLEAYFGQFGKTETESNLFDRIAESYLKIVDLLNTPYCENKSLAHEQSDVDKIKDLLDCIKALQWFIKPLLGKGNEAEKDERFYGEFSVLWSTLDQITPLYNKVRNYMTRKPYSTDKIKLNFENSTLLDGWDVNKEPDNTSVILRKDGMYYLGILNRKYNKIFKEDFDGSEGAMFEKMEYKLLPGANKMLPKVFFSKSRIEEFNPSEQLINNYSKEKHKKGDHFDLQFCHELIDFFKSSINKHEDWKNFNFSFSDTRSYEDLSGFYREVEHQGYKLTFKSVPEKFIYKMVDEGKLYLFQIYNKDFSPHSKGTPNMHTLYWKMIFDAENIKNVVYKLNGQAEIFFRKASIKKENRIVHEANQPVANKNAANSKQNSVFEYDLIKDRRYTFDKFQFHVPITMNFKADGINNINANVNQFLRNSDDVHIIGIDRGERHLLYLTLIDSKGRIVEQYSLNEIINEYKGQEYRTNYHDLLDKREGSRTEERRNWKTIESIKELKEGYLSQVVHKITQLMVRYKAIIVLEDLNIGFMRGRQKVEKSVYQQFEKMLIDKLNYLADKKNISSEPGGILNAYQLTNKFESFQKMGKQSGFLFYVPAWNTSKMDPVTGFVNLLDTRYENMEKAKTFFQKFEAIRFNNEKGYFEFVIKNYSHFNAKAEGTRQNWTICTYGTRIETFRNPEKNNQWDNHEIDLSASLSKLFGKFHIDPSKNIREQVLMQNEKAFFEPLLHLLKLTVQMRNSITNTDIDYLVSPVADERGEFFDSRKSGSGLPQNADANGAYNIARKGLWILEQMKTPDVDLKKLKLAISNKEWLVFAQNRC